ncbi:unnamed protein product [Penicillium roqueforti FM164]|uniref:Uncharacterized protein n=1 Tax=Penicillium roqueforti (strain FM164) TaxID=1365484 RepID=W6QLI3_PENRF|nr:unnamed protein product [Penicillium roqueforti FM164]
MHIESYITRGHIAHCLTSHEDVLDLLSLVDKIPTDQEAKLRYNAERLVCSTLVQEYRVMIQKDSSIPIEVNPEDEYYSQLLKISVARTLCLCLMAFRSPTRGQEWRNSTRSELLLWTTSFDHTRSLTRPAMIIR